MKKILLGIALLLVVVAGGVNYLPADKMSFLPDWLIKIKSSSIDQSQLKTQLPIVNQKIVYQESVVTNVVKKVSPSVVTVGIKKTTVVFDDLLFGQGVRQRKIEQDIGSGFVVTKDGLVITNKHVVSDPQASYKVITSAGKKYDVVKIYRDPTIDLAILKIEADDLKPLELGDSSKIQLGQMAIAIGTALGEFRNTVTVGVISGLGRGIVAGDGLGAFSERLDNVIQTDAAINPGNSGGPLLNSAGQVVGVNVAVAQGAENIGFAIPINTVKEALDNFEKTGRFSRPYLGVQFNMISRDLAILQEIPEGAYVRRVLEDSPAAKAGIEPGDIIVKIDGQRIRFKDGGLIKVIQKKKVGQKITIEVWRDGETKKLTAVLEESKI